jgi:hypothetical protein
VAVRITVSHNKGQKEAMRAVNGAADQILRPDLPGPVKFSSTNRKWDGSTLNFTLSASLGPVSVPIHGKIIVTETDITIDCDLPNLLTQFVSERSLESGMAAKIRGLLR